MVYSPPYEAAALGVPRVRAIGDPLMPLNDTYPKSVVFVIGLREDKSGTKVQTEIGTAFYVSMPTAVPDRTWIYLVTARHVVECETETWVRVRMDDGSLQTLPVPRWTLHSQADVAVAFVFVSPRLDCVSIPEATMLDVWPKMPTLGDRVYFIGLLSGVTSMAKDNVPMVRSGTLGRMYQEDVLLKRCDETLTHQQVHLIDCRSYAGFSGSPCFVQFQSTRKEGDPPRTGMWIGGVSIVPETVCLGLISGHLDEMTRVKGTGQYAKDAMVESIRSPINTGVGIVTPAERIRECLMDDELVADRAARDARLVERALQEEKDKAVTPDSIGESTGEMTKADFEAALRKVSRKQASQPAEGTSGT